MASGNGGSPYIKKEWDAESGSWVAKTDHVPDPSATVPGQYVSDELYQRISTGSFTKEDVKAFQEVRQQFDFPDWASGGMAPGRTATTPARVARRPKHRATRDPTTRAMILGSLGGLVVGMGIAVAAILLVVLALVFLT